MVCSFSDVAFSFPGMRDPAPFPDRLREVVAQVSAVTKTDFNYVLANLYRDGRDHTGWHADKAQYHRPDSDIAIVSLGATRRFRLRDTKSLDMMLELDLPPRSLLVMTVAMQEATEHDIPPMPGLEDSRVSLTLRCLNDPSSC